MNTYLDKLDCHVAARKTRGDGCHKVKIIIKGDLKPIL